MILRALGRSLTSSSVSGRSLIRRSTHDSNGALLFSRDNWRTTQEMEIIKKATRHEKTFAPSPRAIE